jgi:hypothetical protein
LSQQANEYAVSIRTDLAADLPKITADRVQLQQVLMNLMLNGIEAMKETGGVLTVKTAPGEGGQVLISVSDTGVGLPAGRTDEIFNASSPLNLKAAAWDRRSAVQSWNRMVAVCGPHPTTNEARRFISLCQPQSSWKRLRQYDSEFLRVRQPYRSLVCQR